MSTREVTAICPGSCGELMQGIIGGRELLVSYPINRYSEITVRSGDSSKTYSTSCRKILHTAKAVLEYLNIPVNKLGTFEIIRRSSLPLGKGMSSSTADIGATAAAVAAFFGYELTSDEIAAMAASIEPTDGILYEDLMLFDSVNGEAVEMIGPVPPLKVLVLEGIGLVDTICFHKKRSYVPVIDAAYDALCSGVSAGDWAVMGNAAIMSARLYQSVLPKPYLDDIIDIAMRKGAYGVNVAHTGTALGIIMDTDTDERALVEALRTRGILEFYGQHYVVRMVKGGPRIISQPKRHKSGYYESQPR
ncbi:MAG: L-threonine kinase [Clostridiales bacterium]|nr:L-threonine kinase [Clostridiales bacterium]MDK2991352.1 L-threonine kinase [Clostridiales bacterium]